jgi:hypothetical protein
MEEMRRMISALPGIEEITTNESIGTMTVLYDQRRHRELQVMLSSFVAAQPRAPKAQPAAGNGAAEGSPHLGDLDHIDTMLEREAEFLASHSHTAQALFEGVAHVDQEIKRLTGNAVDLKVILPAALAVGVFLELGIAAATPVWLTLGLFSFNHFVELHTPPPEPKTPAEKSNGHSHPHTHPPHLRRKLRRFP